LSPIDGSFYFSGRAAGQVAVAAPTTSVPLQPPSLSEKIHPAEIPTSKSRYFRVADDVSQGILNMRAAPSTKAPIIVAIPAGTTGLKVGDCKRTDDGNYPWCEIRWREYEGWASSCCIVEMNVEARTRFRVLSNVSQGILNLRNGPGGRHALIGSMPAGATDVFVSSCRKSDDDEKPWCKVEWRGHRGWASSCCLVDSETGAYARVGEY